KQHIIFIVNCCHTETPKPTVTIKPAQHVFRGDTVTLRCDINAEGVTSWQYSWYKDGSVNAFSDKQEHTFSSVTESDAGKYSCDGGERGGSRTSHRSDEVTLTVSVPRAVLSVSPQTWLTEGDPVTLICEVKGSSTGWTFSWFTLTLSSDYRYRYDLLSDSSRGAGGNYTVTSAALKKHRSLCVQSRERRTSLLHTVQQQTVIMGHWCFSSSLSDRQSQQNSTLHICLSLSAVRTRVTLLDGQ
uniref:Ig-like domain-containing protein n=1 Tax=Cyprinus carpio TaxID=7962 RepID=A0A8C1Q663_CYPCA